MILGLNFYVSLTFFGHVTCSQSETKFFSILLSLLSFLNFLFYLACSSLYVKITKLSEIRKN